MEQRQPAQAPVKVLYVMGRGRSGSTIFANVLGELDGYAAVGEVRFLWDPIVAANTECACGKPVRDCEMWSKVMEKLSDVDAARAAHLQRVAVRESKLWSLLRSPSDEAREYASVMGRVYAALASVSGARVLVDSSKRPSYAALLRHVPNVETYYIHLVREPRASAHSWKQRRHESVFGGEVTRRGALDATLRWDALNVGAELVTRQAGPGRSARIRFEDFIAEPRRWLEAVTALVGEPSELPLVGESSVRLGVNHAVSGNPSRQSSGVVELKDSREWVGTMGKLDRWLAAAVSLPLMLRYGYPLRPSRS